MRIACPTCTAEYEVPLSMIGPGKSVRCARCRTVWHVAAPDAAPPVPVSQVEPPPVPAIPTTVGEAARSHPAEADRAERPAYSSAFPIAATTELIRTEEDELVPVPVGLHVRRDESALERLSAIQPVRPRRMTPVLAAWVLSLAIVAGGLAAAYRYRADVMDAWPASRRVFAALGISR